MKWHGFNARQRFALVGPAGPGRDPCHAPTLATTRRTVRAGTGLRTDKQRDRLTR